MLDACTRCVRAAGSRDRVNAYLTVRHLETGDTFDAARGVNHERATLRDAGGHEASSTSGRRVHAARLTLPACAAVSSSMPCTV